MGDLSDLSTELEKPYPISKLSISKLFFYKKAQQKKKKGKKKEKTKWVRVSRSIFVGNNVWRAKSEIPEHSCYS